MASLVPCACETLATLRFRHLGHLMQPGDCEDMSINRLLHFVQGAGLLDACMYVCMKTGAEERIKCD
jgi:hypothetical protein